MSALAHPFDLGQGLDAPSPWALDSSTQASFALDEVHGYAVVVAAGEIDLCTSPGLREALADAVRRSDRVVIDLTRVRFLDSTGMAVMVEALGRDQHRRAGALVGPTGLVTRALEITGLTALFPIYPTVEDAVGALLSPRQRLRPTR